MNQIILLLRLKTSFIIKLLKLIDYTKFKKMFYLMDILKNIYY